MKKLSFLCSIMLLTSTSIYADVIPNPIQVKGIVPNGRVNIQMVSEVVKVDLFKDSSIVVCTFNMHNLGKAEDLEIGFPIMNFYLWTEDMPNYLLDNATKSNFEVKVNERNIEKVNMYIPDKLKDMLKANNQQLLDTYSNQNRPWYLWKAHFKTHESQQITVKYILPNAANHMYSFFNYLLSTGAGWKGNIERATIIVNLKNIPNDQLIDLSPKGFYKKQKNVITWSFKNLKPTIKDDIFIKYEKVKGSYKAELRKVNSIPWYIDERRTSRKEFKRKIYLDDKDIALLEEGGRFNKENYGLTIYTKEYALKNFKKMIRSLNPTLWKQFSNQSVKTFTNSYELVVDSGLVDNKDLFKKLITIDTFKTCKIAILKLSKGKKRIVLSTK